MLFLYFTCEAAWTKIAAPLAGMFRAEEILVLIAARCSSSGMQGTMCRNTSEGAPRAELFCGARSRYSTMNEHGCAKSQLCSALSMPETGAASLVQATELRKNEKQDQRRLARSLPSREE